MSAASGELSPGERAPWFSLPGVDGRKHALAEVAGTSGTLVMFICNHCPYVHAVVDRIVRDVRDLRALGVGAAAISSNDPINFPDDSFDNMKLFASAHAFDFPYLFDESQDVARAFGAVCTPEFFGFDRNLQLRYRGRLDASRKDPVPNAPRELYDAMVAIARTGVGPPIQHPSFGCSIKWRMA